MLPFVRLDYSISTMEDDILGQHTLLEAGWGPIAAEYRYTLFDESSPDDTLKLHNWNILYRMSFGNYVEIDLGGGKYQIKGDHHQMATSLTAPVKIDLEDRLGIEYRPVWTIGHSFDLSDHELALLWGPAHYVVRTGYRWIHAGNASLNGPFLGFSLFF